MDQWLDSNSGNAKTRKWTKKILFFIQVKVRVNSQTLCCLNQGIGPGKYDSWKCGMALVMLHRMRRKEIGGQCYQLLLITLSTIIGLLRVVSPSMLLSLKMLLLKLQVVTKFSHKMVSLVFTFLAYWLRYGYFVIPGHISVKRLNIIQRQRVLLFTNFKSKKIIKCLYLLKRASVF